METKGKKCAKKIMQPKKNFSSKEKLPIKRRQSFAQNSINIFGPNSPIISLSPLGNNKCNYENITTELNLKSENIDMSVFTKKYEEYGEGEASSKSYGTVKSYGFNSYKGLFKERNEDKVIVVGQIKKPHNSLHKIWPKMSFFAIFDGHGGESCSNFLKDNFLNILVENKNFPSDIKTSLVESFGKAEEEFYKRNIGKSREELDCSGSCALVLLISDNKLYIANLGDSRAIMSSNGGTKLKVLTIDHKPNNPVEFERAIKNGSKIYIDNDEQSKDVEKLRFIKDLTELKKYNNEEDVIFREYPSDLAVMRTIGDYKSKKKEFGGNPGSIINIPEIFIYDFSPLNDFIVLGCDGIFDDLSNETIIACTWFIFKNLRKERKYDIHELTRDASNMIIKFGLDKLTSDNLTCIVIGLEGLYKYLNNSMVKDKANVNVMVDRFPKKTYSVKTLGNFV